jgi:hypothetical protein
MVVNRLVSPTGDPWVPGLLGHPPLLGLPLSLPGRVRLPLRGEVCAEQSMASPPIPGAQGSYSGFFVGSVPFFPVPAAPLRRMENGT